MEVKKQAISLRISSADLRNVKRLGQRLGVRDSDVVRFAVKTMLSKLAPLSDPNVRGRNLVPVFVESGPEIIRHFDLDAARLDGIINEGVDAAQCVAHDDIQLLAMSGAQQAYVKLSLRSLGRRMNGETRGGNHEDPFDGPLKQYLYVKYGYAEIAEPVAPSADQKE